MNALFLIEKWDEENFLGNFKARLKLQPSLYILTVTGLDAIEARLLPNYDAVVYVSLSKIEVMV